MIKFEDIKKANESIVTTDIKGKSYAEVNQRIKAFRMVYPLGSIQTEIISMEGNKVVMKATVCNEQGVVLGSGTAYEKEGSSFINKTSYIENCETSAVGRALAMCGFGIDTSIASAEEVANAIEQQDEIKNEEVKEGKYKSWLDNYFATYPDQLDSFLKKKKLTYLEEIDTKLSLKQIDKLITDLKQYMAKHNNTGIYSEEETF